MSAGMTSNAERFVAYFGELGPRWGLPTNACRVHAYLYLMAKPMTETEITEAVSIDPASLAQAMAYLADFQMVTRTGSSHWQTSGDPWDMLVRGLEQRRHRELPAALSMLRDCQKQALSGKAEVRSMAGQIGKMLSLVEDLAALDAQAQRLSPKLLRGLINVSGRAARFMDRALGSKR